MFWRSKKPSPPPDPAGQAPSGDEGNVTTTHFLTGDSDLDRRSVEVLLGAIAGVSQSRDLNALLVDIVDRSVEITGAERGMLILSKKGAPKEGDVDVRVARGRGGEDIREDLRFSTSVVRKVLWEGQPVRATVQSDSDALELGRSVFDLKLRAVMCVPLVAHESSRSEGGGHASDAVSGVLYVDSRAATRSFNQRDLSLFAALSQHISIALENARLNLHSVEKARLEQSLELASAIQSGLMPSIPEDRPDLDLHGWYRPAERTSGDFFDFVRTRDGRLGVVVGDVTGHGIGPALITASAQASLRSYLRVVAEAGPAVTLLNQDLGERMDPGMFVTLLLVVLGEEGRCELVNAGHAPPILWRKQSGEATFLTEHGTALGMVADAEFEPHETLTLEPGDVLVAYTDGLVESHRPDDRDDLFGDERLMELVSELAAEGTGAEPMALALAEAALEFSQGDQEDDITLVVVRRV